MNQRYYHYHHLHVQRQLTFHHLHPDYNQSNRLRFRHMHILSEYDFRQTDQRRQLYLHLTLVHRPNHKNLRIVACRP